MQPLVQLFNPNSHAGARCGSYGPKRRVMKDIIEIFINYCRLINYLAVVNDRWHHTVRIEFKIIGLMLITGTKIKMMRCKVQFFFSKCETYFLRAGRHTVMIKLDHIFSLLGFAKLLIARDYPGKAILKG